MRRQFSLYLLAFLINAVIASVIAQSAAKQQAFENWRGNNGKSYQSDVELKLRYFMPTILILGKK